jgi:5-methylcytosine-specific restriction endonuclease McrA
MRPKRKAIPATIKIEVFLRQKGLCMECCNSIEESAEYDHRPALILRPVNPAGTDYMPRQLDPDYIEALHGECHQKRTTGRKPGAERTITTKGSDIHLAKKFRQLERGPKPKRGPKIQSRGFSKEKRAFNRRAK